MRRERRVVGKKSAAGGRYRTPTPLSCSPSLPLSRGAGGGCIFSFFPPLSVSLPSHQLAYLPPLPMRNEGRRGGESPARFRQRRRLLFRGGREEPSSPLFRSRSRPFYVARKGGAGERESLGEESERGERGWARWGGGGALKGEEGRSVHASFPLHLLIALGRRLSFRIHLHNSTVLAYIPSIQYVVCRGSAYKVRALPRLRTKT